MSLKLLWFVRLVGVGFAAYVIYKVKHNELSEKESMYWIVGTLCLVLMAIWPHLVDQGAEFLGITYQPALLFFGGILFILALLFRQAGHISQLKENIKELAQMVAILEMEMRGARDGKDKQGDRRL